MHRIVSRERIKQSAGFLSRGEAAAFKSGDRLGRADGVITWFGKDHPGLSLSFFSFLCLILSFLVWAVPFRHSDHLDVHG